jgi:hypothetical protein
MRFGISETSWMFPKILRMRLDAVGRVSVAGAALVAMEIFSRFLVPAKAGIPVKTERTNAKSRGFPVRKLQLQRPVKPQRLNALIALRDGANCSEPLW